jgi:hypothetical protein
MLTAAGAHNDLVYTITAACVAAQAARGTVSVIIVPAPCSPLLSRQLQLPSRHHCYTCLFQKLQASSMAKSTPPIGAPKAAEMPAAVPADTNSRWSAAQNICMQTGQQSACPIAEATHRLPHANTASILWCH